MRDVDQKITQALLGWIDVNYAILKLQEMGGMLFFVNHRWHTFCTKLSQNIYALTGTDSKLVSVL